MSGVMQLVDYLERNLQNYLRDADRSKPVTASRVQRVCRVGYNQALHTIQYFEDKGFVERTDTPSVWRFRPEWVLEEITQISAEAGLYDNEHKECNHD